MYMPKPKKDWKYNIKSPKSLLIRPIHFLNELISMSVSKTKTDVFIAIVLRFSRWNLVIFMRYL